MTLLQKVAGSDHVDSELKKEIMLNLYTRPTMKWSLECELNGEMDRKTALTYYSQNFTHPSGV